MSVDLTRIYIPLNASGLRKLDAEHALGGPPFLAHAVTEAVMAAAPNAHEDEWEYTALNDAAQSSAPMLPSGESRRILAAADVDPEQVAPASAAHVTIESAVSILGSVALNRIASFHMDADDASEDDELLWYDVTELPAILAML